MRGFWNACRSEWLKRRRSLASWLIIGGSFFTPVIVIVARLTQYRRLERLYAAENFWIELWKSSWESMAIFFVPMIAIFVTSLVAQIEFRNNAWKQVHALPISLATIFFSKFAIVLLMLVEFLLLFNFAFYLSGVIPGLVILHHLPRHTAVPWSQFGVESWHYFLGCLPIVAAQYLISLQFRNFLAPIGIGFGLWVGALAALSWKFGYLIPYTYPIFTYLKSWNPAKAAIPAANLEYWALGYFVFFIVLGFGLFWAKKERG